MRRVIDSIERMLGIVMSSKLVKSTADAAEFVFSTTTLNSGVTRTLGHSGLSEYPSGTCTPVENKVSLSSPSFLIVKVLATGVPNCVQRKSTASACPSVRVVADKSSMTVMSGAWDRTEEPDERTKAQVRPINKPLRRRDSKGMAVNDSWIRRRETLHPLHRFPSIIG